MPSVLACFQSVTAARSTTAQAARLGFADDVRTTTTAGETLTRLGENPADVVLVNGSVVAADHVNFVRQVHQLRPRASIVLVGLDDPRMVATAVAAGATGVLRADGNGDRLLSACVLGLLRTGEADIPRRRRIPAAMTPRELEVLSAMSLGFSNAEIGRRLFVSEDTVKTHARRIYRKLGARDRAHAVACAFRTGLFGG